MSQAFSTWEEAHAHALAEANRYKRPMGLERTIEFNRIVFVVRMVPIDPAKRFGWETKCEIVDPD